MKRTMLLLLVCLCLCAKAQKFCEFNVYFDTDQWNILPAEKKKIDSVFNHLDKNVRFDVSITGHTDKRGGQAYNQVLSEKRAVAVEEYIDQHLTAKQSKISGKAFTEMVYTGDEVAAFAPNRRVKVELYYTIPEVSSIGSEKLNRENFHTNNEVNDTLRAASGTKLYIPAEAFVFEDGTPVTGNVSITYVEYRDPIDFILGGIPMTHSEKGQQYIFNSSGMFTISGEQQGKSINIREGKEIGIDFAKTQNVPNTDFFEFDTSDNKWTNLGSTPNSTAGVVQNLSNNHLKDAESVCLYTDCDGLAFIGRAGMEYLKTDAPSVYAQLTTSNIYRDSEVLRMYDSYREKTKLFKATTKELDSLSKLLSSLYNNKYKLELVENKIKERTIRFKINCEDCPANPYENMGDMTWEYKYRSRKSTLPLFDAKLDHCVMLNVSNTGTTSLELKLNNDRRYTTLRRVKPEGAVSTEKLNELYKDYLKRKKHGHKKTKRQLNKKINEAHKRRNHLDKNIQAINQYFTKPFYHRNNDSLVCFHKESKDYMGTAEEREMPTLVWYRYFDKNPDIMRSRYQPFTDSQVLSDKCRQFDIRDSIRLANQGTIAKANQKFEQMKTSLGIATFGTYNCDQLSRIKNPVEILAEYTNENNEKIEIASVFMIDHSINSVLVFNGYMDLWPGRFSYGSRAKNTLVAFDAKGTAYICKPDVFADAVKTSGKLKTFNLTTIGQQATRKDLLAAQK